MLQYGFRATHLRGLYTTSQWNYLFRKAYCSACKPEMNPSQHISSLQKRLADHRELGLQQELFVTSKYSPGSPIFLPNGTKIFNALTDFLRAQYQRFGFQEVITPTIYKKSLWEKSGHWNNYADDMYEVTGRGATGTKEGLQVGKNEEYGLKPMNCPGHCLIFASKLRSYRDLPIRYADFSPLHRNEIHGALSGLTRVRCFHQDDGHIFCRPSQIGDEISKTLEFVKLTYGILGLGPYRLALSTRPENNFIGSSEEWENAERALREALDKSGLNWTLKDRDGAFYGPKIDIILKDSDGKEHQTATIQLDFQLPKRFDLKYQAPAPEIDEKRLESTDLTLRKLDGSFTPVLIHRAVLGSVERIMALLIEHYNGQWPFWLNPRQVVIITLNNNPELIRYAMVVKNTIQGLVISDANEEGWAERGVKRKSAPVSVDINDKAIDMRTKIAEAKRQRYGIIVVVGPRDLQSQTLSVDLSGIPIGNHYANQILWRAITSVQKGGGAAADIDVIKHSCEASGDNSPTLPPKTRSRVIISASKLRNVIEELQDVYS